MKVHRIRPARISKMIERKFSGHIVKQSILENQDKMLFEPLKDPDLVMKLHQDRLCCHLPIHATGPPTSGIDLRNTGKANRLQKPLPLWPDGPNRIERLQLGTNKVTHLTISDRGDAVVQTPTRDPQLADEMNFVSRLMRKQPKTINEDLPPLKQSKWTDYHRIIAMPHCTCAYGYFRLAFSYLVTAFLNEWTLLRPYDSGPLRLFHRCCVTTKQINNL